MIDVRMLCLAALMGRDASGYDIKKDLERGSAVGLIDASFGSIYPALSRLAEEGLIVARSAGGRGPGGKTVYAISAEGRAQFVRMLSGPLPDEKYRSPFLFAMLFADVLPRERVRSLVDQQIVLWEQKIASVEQVAAASPADCAGENFVYGFGLASLKAGLDYLRRHRSKLEAAAGAKAVPPVTDRMESRTHIETAAIAAAGE